MRNKDKLIAEIMAVCCVLSTSTFFNMHGMAQTIITFEEKKGENEINPLGPNISGTIETYVVCNVTYNVGCINFIIDFSKNYSDCVINELLTLLDLKTKTGGSPITNYTTITSETEIDNLGQLFGNKDRIGNQNQNSLIMFTVYAQKSDGEDPLIFNDSETTDSSDQTQFTDVFSIFRIDDKRPTIQYDTTTHKMTLKIYIDLPDNSERMNYTSFSFGVDLKDETMLQIQSST